MFDLYIYIYECSLQLQLHLLYVRSTIVGIIDYNVINILDEQRLINYMYICIYVSTNVIK